MRPGHPALDELGVDLFYKFARIEYALKAAGFHSGEGTTAQPNWDAFALKHGDAMLGDPAIADTIKFMTAYPPKSQIIEQGHLKWCDVRPNGNAAIELLLCVRRVRNNMFHGGKFNDHWLDPQRSQTLIEHTLRVLDACLRASEPLSRAYCAE